MIRLSRRRPCRSSCSRPIGAGKDRSPVCQTWNRPVSPPPQFTGWPSAAPAAVRSPPINPTCSATSRRVAALLRPPDDVLAGPGRPPGRGRNQVVESWQPSLVGWVESSRPTVKAALRFRWASKPRPTLPRKTALLHLPTRHLAEPVEQVDQRGHQFLPVPLVQAAAAADAFSVLLDQAEDGVLFGGRPFTRSLRRTSAGPPRPSSHPRAAPSTSCGAAAVWR